jgi:restriction endonuclease S subunit
MSNTGINKMPAGSDFVSRFNSVISACRDIMRREGITGMDSMKHLTLYILARRLDKKECKRLGISDRFAWEHFVELVNTDKIQDSFELLFNRDGNDLISSLDDLFGTKNFNFKLNGPDNHSAIVKHLSKIDFEKLDGAVDILGMVYENHLGSGSNKSAMRDLGQFFTDRKVCNYMTGLCNPQVLPGGTAESVLDPTMGTGGFLTAYVKWLNARNKKINWAKMKMDVAGYDIDEFVMSVGKINMYLSTGVLFDRIAHRNTLNQDVGEPGQRLKFKIILANEPFGVKGLLYKDCCQRVKDIGINGTKSEPLFLNLMMAALDDGGRCAVVVPDGVLVNSSKQHDGTRKYLLDNFDLKRVIKMKGQFFSNTGIQPFILFFENNGNSTSVVEFWEVEQGSDGAIVEKMVLSVPRSKFDDACSLDMRRYQEVAPVVNTGGFPMVKLEDIIKIIGGKRRTIQEATEDGEYDFITCSIMGTSRINVADFTKEAIIINAINGSGKCRPYYSNRYSTTTNNIHFTLKDDCKNVILKYVYIYLELNSKLLEEGFNGGNQKKIGQEYIKTISILLPPLETQQEIVTALDLIYNNAATAKAAATSVKSQMVAVVRSVGARGFERKKLGDIMRFIGGKRRTVQEADDNGSATFITCSIQGTSKIMTADFTQEAIIINAINGSGKCRAYYSDNYSTTSNNIHFTLKENISDVSLKFIYNLIQYNISILEEGFSGGNQKKISQDYISSVQIPLPPLPIQHEVLAILNEMEAELQTLEQMAAKAEQRAKFILDGYLTPAHTA